ncbi:serine protease [Bdellovibrio bacteriovorus]|uniref:trypsin-like serine peptidase n=1 Tax=Bdellovibrio bacteriovorus TaxID=959 RepID=UPI0035A65C98
MKFIVSLLLASTFSSLAHAEICGGTDDRALSFDSKVGRLVKDGATQGCTVTLVSDNCVVTVGACALDRDYVEFNVPVSVAGVAQKSSLEDRYYVEKGTERHKADGIGHQWAVLRLKPNEVTGKNAGAVQGFYHIATKKSQNNDPIRVVSYGYALNDLYDIKHGEMPANSNPEQMHFAQQVSHGKLVKAGIFLIPEIIEHDADTSYGSWGAPVINEKTNELVGINTHGGCRAQYVVKAGARYTNSGTSITGSSAFSKAIKACVGK